jgi:hypothetical protein
MVGFYAGVPLQDAANTWCHGAVFLLRKAPPRSASVSLDGWVTSVVEQAKIVVTCGPSKATSFDDTFADALTAANRGLDYMSVRGQADSAIRDAADDCLVWWPDHDIGGTVMRCRAIETMAASMSMTATVKDAAGNVVPSPPPPTPLAHDVFRFVRMSRTSDDLYDSYRNLFLAFECLLCDLRLPQQLPNGRWENEKQWFTAALAVADQLVPLANLAPTGTADPVGWIYQNIYSAERSALMHAKRQYLLPQDDTSKQQLTASLGKLWTYITELIAKHLGVTHLSGYMSLYAVEKMAKAVLPQFAMVVSDDDSARVTPGSENLISSSSAVVELRPSTPAADPDDPRLWTLLAHCHGADLAELTAIRRFGLKEIDSDHPAHVLSDFVGPLAIDRAVARLEMAHGLRIVNESDAPRRFSS